jgi:hypothetical protein
MKQFLLYLFVCLVFYACNKNSTDNGCHDSTLMKQVKLGGNTTQQITYNSNCLVKESIGQFAYKKYIYDDQNKLTKTEEALTLDLTSCFIPVDSMNINYSDPRKAKITQYSTLEYNKNGMLVKKLNYFINNGNDELISYSAYEYSNNLISKTNLYNPQDLLISYNEYRYDGNGNMSEEKYFLVEGGINATLLVSYTYEFDDKNNPLIIFKAEGIPGIFTNTNNILKETLVNYSGSSEYKNVTQNVLEYNNSGYPVKVNDQDYIYGE